MTGPAGPRKSLQAEEHRLPAATSAALLPGVGLLFVGLWMVTDGGPIPLGGAFFAVGWAFLFVGAGG